MSGYSAVVEDEDLVFAGQMGQGGGAVAGQIVAAGPGGIPAQPMVGHQRVAVAAAGADDDEAVNEQRRRTHAPVGLPTPVGEGVPRPQAPPGGQVEAIETAGGAHGEDAVPLNGGRGAGADAAKGGLVTGGVAVAPKHLPGADIATHHLFQRTVLLLGDGVRPLDRECRPPFSHLPPPNFARWMSFPIRLQLEAGQDGVAIGAQKLGEVPEGQSARTVGHGCPRDGPVLCPRPAPPDDGDELAADAAKAQKADTTYRQGRHHANAGEPYRSRQTRKVLQPADQSEGGDRQSGHGEDDPVGSGGRVPRPDDEQGEGTQRENDRQRPPAGPCNGSRLHAHFLQAPGERRTMTV